MSNLQIKLCHIYVGGDKQYLEGLVQSVVSGGFGMVSICR